MNSKKYAEADTRRFSCYFRDDVYDRIKAFADYNGLPVNSAIQFLCIQHLDALEAYKVVPKMPYMIDTMKEISTIAQLSSPEANEKFKEFMSKFSETK